MKLVCTGAVIRVFTTSPSQVFEPILVSLQRAFAQIANSGGRLAAAIARVQGMTCTPEYLTIFARKTGIDIRDWKVWSNEVMLSVSGIRQQDHACSLRDYLVEHKHMQAEINEPIFKDDAWGVVAIPLDRH